ncbi:MAG: FtsX-like permease family protein [Dehalococcoidia bacterium]
MTTFRSLPVLAVRRMLGNWRLLSSVVVGTVVAAAILSATAIYADAIRDLGLRYALREQPPAALDVSVVTANVTVSGAAYQRSVARQDAAAASALRGTGGGVVRVATSATFFPADAGRTPDSEDQARPRANLVARSGLQDHVTVVQGALPAAAGRGGNTPLPVAIGEETARQLNLRVGSTLDLFPFWDDKVAPLRVQVSGIVRANTPGDRYWGPKSTGVDAAPGGWPTVWLFVPEGTFFGAAVERVPTMSADYENRYIVRTDALNARIANAIADGLSRLTAVIAANEARPSVTSTLEGVLRSFDQKLFFTRIPLFVLLLQIGGIVAYYLVMVSTMLVERQAAEIATLRSRGAATAQLLAQYGIEGAILALLAAVVGPPVAAAVVSALGPTPAFSSLSGGGPLPVHVGSGAYLLAVVGAMLAFGSLMIPAWRATRVTVLEFKRGAARPRPTPLLLRYYADVLAVGIVALAFWRLSRESTLVTQTLFGGAKVDPFLLATPAVFMVTVGIVFLRLFPLAMRGIGWLVSQTRSAAVLIGVRSLVRNPTHYARLILLLMFATGVGMFGATFSATLDRSYEERAGYESGADVRASGVTLQGIAGDREFLSRIAAVPADARTAIARVDGSVTNGTRSQTVQVLGVDPKTFGDVAFFREDFADASLEAMLGTLDQNGATLAPGPKLPANARQLGVWVRMTDIRGRVALGVNMRDATGRVTSRLLGDARPGDPATSEWTFFSTDLQQPTALSGAPLRQATPVPPYEIRGLYFQPVGAIANQRGVIEFGPAFASASAPASTPPGADPPPLSTARAAWPDAVLVQDFTRPGFEVIQGLRPVALKDVLGPAPDGPPGFASSLRYEWQDTASPPSLRGLRPTVDVAPAQVFLSRHTAQELEIRPGDTVTLAVSQRHLNATVAGFLDYFPTYRPAPDAGLVVINGSRLATAINGALTDQPLGPNEAWFSTAEPGATRAALDTLNPRSIVALEAVRAQQQEDPLIAAGWAGILAIAFGAVLLLSAIGFIVYSYLTAQQRALEFAILRTLGFSRPQIFSLVLFEHLFVIAAGMGLGTLVGLRVGRLMLAFLGIDEHGGQVVPPFVQRISWGEVFVVWGILGTVFVATIAAVVALYFRLAVSRALRIGDA